MPISRRWDSSPFRIPLTPSRRLSGRFSWKMKRITARARTFNFTCSTTGPSPARLMNLSASTFCLSTKNGDASWHTCPGRPKTYPRWLVGESRRWRHLSGSIFLYRSSKRPPNPWPVKTRAGLPPCNEPEHNIDEMVDTLNQTFRRLRQTSIDEELFDVLSGYESLTKRKTR